MIITIDGVDRTGKNTLHGYLALLTNHKYVITDRGILTQIAYNEKFNRGINYNINNYRNNIIVYLYAEPEDLKIRCKLTNEPPFDIKSDLELFTRRLEELEGNGFIVYRYNTSINTPFAIALDLKEKLEELEETML